MDSDSSLRLEDIMSTLPDDYDMFKDSIKICITCKKEVSLQKESEHVRFYGNTSYWPGYTECGNCLDKRHGYKV